MKISFRLVWITLNLQACASVMQCLFNLLLMHLKRISL